MLSAQNDLRGYRRASRTVVVEPEQNGQENGKGERCKDLSNTQVPKPDKPVAIASWCEGIASRQHLEIDLCHPPYVHETGEEDEGERGAIVLEEDTNRVSEEAAGAEFAAEVGDHEDEEGGDDGEVEGSIVAKPLEDLDALLEVDEGNVEAEDVAGKAGDPAEPVARVSDGKDPMKNQRPAWLMSV